MGLIKMGERNAAIDLNPPVFMKMGGTESKLDLLASTGALPRCRVYDNEGGIYGWGKVRPDGVCLDLVYAPANVPEVVDIMSTLATKEDLTVYGSGSGTQADDNVLGNSNLAGFDDVETMRTFLKNHEGSVGGAIVFHTNNTDPNCDIPSGRLPCKVKYEIWYNQTYGGKFVTDWGGDIMVRDARGSTYRHERCEAVDVDYCNLRLPLFESN